MALAFFLILFGDFLLSGVGEIDTPISEKKARLVSCLRCWARWSLGPARC